MVGERLENYNAELDIELKRSSVANDAARI
jgi:hypothetical protein